MKSLSLLLIGVSLGLGAAFHPLATHQEPTTQTMSKSKPQKITTFLWYDDDAEEAARFYCSIFEDSKVLQVNRWGGDGGPAPKGSVMTVTFQLAGQEFIALNGGPTFRFNEAVSLFVHCETQREIDELWTKLQSGGGEPSQCGWLKDRYGLSWQIVPDSLVDMLADKDPARAARVTAAMMQMGKLDLAGLKQAYGGR